MKSSEYHSQTEHFSSMVLFCLRASYTLAQDTPMAYSLVISNPHVFTSNSKWLPYSYAQTGQSLIGSSKSSVM